MRVIVAWPSTRVPSKSTTDCPGATPRRRPSTTISNRPPGSARTVASTALQRYGYRVTEAGSAVEAAQRWHAEPDAFDLLLTDIIMPGGVSGQQLAEELRQHRPDLRVVFTSGYNNEHVTRQLHLEPGVNFLAKPYPVVELLAIVRRRLDQNGTAPRTGRASG